MKKCLYLCVCTCFYYINKYHISIYGINPWKGTNNHFDVKLDQNDYIFATYIFSVEMRTLTRLNVHV